MLIALILFVSFLFVAVGQLSPEATKEEVILSNAAIMMASGEVILDHSGGISRDNIEKGFVLACCSIPKGDIEI